MMSRFRSFLLAFAFFALSLLPPGLASAEGAPLRLPEQEEGQAQDAHKAEHAARAPKEASRFYQALSLEGVREAASLHARAVSRVNMAFQMAPNERLGELLFAESEIQRARRLLPKDMNIHWTSIQIANLLFSMSSPAEEEMRRARYRDELLAFRENFPAIRADNIAFALAIIAVKEGRYKDAANEYEHTLKATRDDALRQTTLANLGEAWMLAGDLERSAETFREALAHAGSSAISPRSRILVLMGAAVALDRLGHEEEAVSLAAEARRISRGEIVVLRDESVFYEPEGEIAIYDYMSAKALAHEAAEAGDERGRAEAERRALQALQTFLEIAKESPYRAHAEERLRALSR